MTAKEGKDYAPAVRLIFEYEGTNIHLVARQQVETIPPPSERLEDQQGAVGFWVEVRDVEQNALYRRILHDPVRHDAEVFSENPERSIARIPVKIPRGAFAVLVPDIEAADHVTLMSSPLGRGPSLAPASEVASFTLRPGTEESSDPDARGS